jgi:3'(2'), 5'-bisphosphate nucleotidase
MTGGYGMRADTNGAGIGRLPVDFTVVDDVLWAKLTAAVAMAAAATLEGCGAVRMKADQSPVTDADERSQAVLLEALARLMPGVAVVSEEMPVRQSHLGHVFVLVDPLDGTKEFVRGSGEFTVNLAIIREGEPVAGIVAQPSTGVVYRGRVRQGAERLAMPPGSPVPAASQPLRVRAASRDAVAIVSRSHLDPATVAELDRRHIDTRIPCGSALKFCRIAEGAADIYPRLAPTREWDIAAGHAVVAAAGGAVTRPDGSPLLYGDAASDFFVPAFIAWGDRADPAQADAVRK